MTSVVPRQASAQDTIDPRDPILRLSQLFDVDSMTLLRPQDKSGVVIARGTVNGAKVVSYCTDGTIMGGAMGIDGCKHIVESIDLAYRERIPVVGLWHSGGARLPEGVEVLHAVGEVFAAMIRVSGKIPQISVVVGAAAGGAAYGPALTDVVIMSPAGRVFVTGPDVVRSVTGEEIDQEGLGGADAHGRKSGVVHVLADSEPDAFDKARELLDHFTLPGHFDLNNLGAEPNLRELLPESAKRAYDIKPVVKAIVDEGTFYEFQEKWAPNIVVGLARMGGRSIGVIANNPLRKGGCLDSLSAEKSARFVRFCDSFGIPLLVLVDVPGYLPGLGQEWGGVVRRGAKLLHAFSEAVIPRVTLVVRKSYGGAYIAMNSRSLGATKVFAWPDAEVAVMGAKAAVGILHRKKIAAVPEAEREGLTDQLIAEHERIAGGVSRAMSIGVVDEIIEPTETRGALAKALAEAPAGRGNHGNIPL
jgi:acetyl-CoA/propionyl-CoA carboxylase carboxyl transferase subunit